MKEKTYLIGHAIQADTINEFNDHLKTFCLNHKVVNITYHSTIPFLAYIDYEVTEDVPETLHDKFTLKRDWHICGECPFLEQPTDGRRKKLICAKSGKMRRKDDVACEEYYMEKGEANEVNLPDIIKSDGGEGLGHRGFDEGVAS